jgi:hypothetical protein
LVLIIGTLITITSQVYAASDSKKVLMIVSGNGQNEKEGEEKPGYEFDEFSKAYSVFKNNGIVVDIASPKGGQVEADKYNPEKPYNAVVLADKAIMAELNNTLQQAP